MEILSQNKEYGFDLTQMVQKEILLWGKNSVKVLKSFLFLLTIKSSCKCQNTNYTLTSIKSIVKLNKQQTYLHLKELGKTTNINTEIESLNNTFLA